MRRLLAAALTLALIAPSSSAAATGDVSHDLPAAVVTSEPAAQAQVGLVAGLALATQVASNLAPGATVSAVDIAQPGVAGAVYDRWPDAIVLDADVLATAPAHVIISLTVHEIGHVLAHRAGDIVSVAADWRGDEVVAPFIARMPGVPLPEALSDCFAVGILGPDAPLSYLRSCEPEAASAAVAALGVRPWTVAGCVTLTRVSSACASPLFPPARPLFAAGPSALTP